MPTISKKILCSGNEVVWSVLEERSKKDLDIHLCLVRRLPAALRISFLFLRAKSRGKDFSTDIRTNGAIVFCSCLVG